MNSSTPNQRKTGSVSVIVPCFNYGRFLADCLTSVQSQTLEDFECIIVDDGSTDDTLDVVTPFLSSDQRFKLVQQSNRGLPAARNAGLKIAKGHFIQLLDADDKIESEKLKVQVCFLQENSKVDLVYGDAAYFRSEAPTTYVPGLKGREDDWMPRVSAGGDDLLKQLLDYNIMVVSSPLFRHRLLASCGFFNEDLVSLEDWELWLRYALNGAQFTYNPIGNTRTLIRIHDQNMSLDDLRMCESSLAIRAAMSPRLKRLSLRTLNCLRALQTSKDVYRIQGKSDSPKSLLEIFKPLPAGHGLLPFLGAAAWWGFRKIRSGFRYRGQTANAKL